MFRPPPYHPLGGPPRHDAPYPGSSQGLVVGAPSVPSLYARGNFHTSPFHGGPYHGFSPAGGLLHPMRPHPPPVRPPCEAPPPPPSETNVRLTIKHAPPPPPPMPKDPEMLKNIEILSSFVVKNGPQFENMARAKQAGDPKFAFLFGGEWGTDAALGFEFYNWKKEHLMWVEDRSRVSSADQLRASQPNFQGQYGGSGAAGHSHELPVSPTGSDMDMEDDFAVPAPTVDKGPDSGKISAAESAAAERKTGLSKPSAENALGLSSPAAQGNPELVSSPSLQRRPTLLNTASEGKSARLPVEAKLSMKMDVPVNRDSSQQGADRESAVQLLGLEPQVSAHGDTLQQSSNVDNPKRDAALPEMLQRRHTRRRTGFDRACMEDVISQCSLVSAEKQEAYPAHQRKSPSVRVSDHKGPSTNEHQQAPMRPSRWGPPDLPPENLAGGESMGLRTSETILRGQRNKKTNLSSPNRGDNPTRDKNQTLDISSQNLISGDIISSKHIKELKPKSGSDQPVVDEFGRLPRQGGSDSDGDDYQYSGGKKRRRTSSRSGSGSPLQGDARYRRWSPGRPPHQRVRKSRSWSHSPRRNRSRSPQREGRWEGEGRGDRGRRGGRGVGGPPPTCYEFATKGKCSRGAFCKFFHEKSKVATADQGSRWTAGRGRGGISMGSGQQSEGNWDSRSGEDAKSRRGWITNGQMMDEDSKEIKLVEDQKKQSSDFTGNAPSQQDKGNSKKPVIEFAEEPGRAANPLSVKSSSEFFIQAFIPSTTVPHALPLESSISMRSPATQAAQQVGCLPNPISSQQSDFSSTLTASGNQLGSFISTSVSQPPPFMVSPTPHNQQFQYSSVSPLSKHTALYNLPTLNQSLGFAPNALHPIPTFSSGSPLLPTLQPALAPLPMGPPLPSFGEVQPAQFSQVSDNCGHGGIQLRPPASGAQPQLQSPMIQNLHPGPGLHRVSGGLGPSVSYFSGFSNPPSVSAHPLFSIAPNIVPSYSVPVSYAPPSYSTVPTKNPAPPRSLFSNDQYDPLADSLEPEPPGSGDKRGAVLNNQSSSQETSVRPSAAEQWRHHAGSTSVPLTTNAGEVVLENVSPGLPAHLDNSKLGNGIAVSVSPAPLLQIVTSNVSPTDVNSTLEAKALLNLRSSQTMEVMENVSPPDENPSGAGEVQGDSKSKEQKKKDKEGRLLNLIRKAVAEHVKGLLKPTWKEGQMSKEAFKTIAKKAVDKVMGALEAKGQIPKSQEKMDLFMNNSKPKIAKLVQGYVEKYVKA